MKNGMKWFGIFTFVAIIGFIFIACDGGDNGGNSNNGVTKFEGRWLNLYAIDYGYSDFSWTFTGNNCVFKAVDGGGTTNRPGTFTFTDTTITFIAPPDTWQGYTQGYTIIDNVLNLEEAGENPLGPFTKQ